MNRTSTLISFQTLLIVRHFLISSTFLIIFLFDIFLWLMFFAYCLTKENIMPIHPLLVLTIFIGILITLISLTEFTSISLNCLASSNEFRLDEILRDGYEYDGFDLEESVNLIDNLKLSSKILLNEEQSAHFDDISDLLKNNLANERIVRVEQWRLLLWEFCFNYWYGDRVWYPYFSRLCLIIQDSIIILTR